MGTQHHVTPRERISHPACLKQIVISVYEESNSVDDETDEDVDNNNNESSKSPSNADAFSALEIVMEWYQQQSECCPTQLLLLKRIRDLAVKKRKCTKCPVSHTAWIAFGNSNNRLSVRCPVPIDSDK
ncbi:uncharacterized protein TNCV_2679481 [Trichonephila clavipes]|nr:uncharacterized protein TNCV_2679481 [Trichonephila clavipes]